MTTAPSTYTELKTAITDWYKDRSDLATWADAFIDMAESMLSLKLRVREMETSTDLTPTSNVCTLPSDYIEAKRVIELASIRRPLEYITEDAADAKYPTRSSGLSCNYMIVGSELTALPLSSNDIELTYYQSIPPLTDSNTTNWLLTKLPNLYLHSCLLYAAEFLKDADEILKETQFVQTFIATLNEADNRAKLGNAGMTLSGPVW